MNVLLVNGSPNQEGCTFTALSEVAKSLNEEGIETSFFHLGVKPVYGCTACGKCFETKRCVFDSDRVNVLIESMAKADGIVIGSPVYYAGANGALCAMLDRASLQQEPTTLHRFRTRPILLPPLAPTMLY